MKNILRYSEKGKFKLVQFTDVHFADDNELDHQTISAMRNILKYENPDFVYFTGDTVFSERNAEFFEKAVLPVIEANIPWSFVFGNHDTEEGAGHEELLSIAKNLPGCQLVETDDKISGYGNHYFELRNSKDECEWLLFGIDSGDYCEITDGYGYIKHDQIQWFVKTIENTEASSFSVITFMHIPLQEYKWVWDLGGCTGVKRENIECSYVNSGFYSAMLQCGHGKMICAGHDHLNDYIGDFFGVTLAYGRATGYNTYGAEDFKKGARIIELTENDTENINTYIRLEDGTIIQ